MVTDYVIQYLLIILIFLIIVFGVVYPLLQKYSFKMPKLSKMPKIEFTDSHWVTIYKVCGWIALIIAVILLFQNQHMSAVYFVCMGLSSFLAAHILRLLEKGVHHLENLDKRGEIEMKDKEDNKE